VRSKTELDWIFSEIEKRGLIFLLDARSKKMYYAYLRRKKEHNALVEEQQIQLA